MGIIKKVKKAAKGAVKEGARAAARGARKAVGLTGFQARRRAPMPAAAMRKLAGARAPVASSTVRPPREIMSRLSSIGGVKPTPGGFQVAGQGRGRVGRDLAAQKAVLASGAMHGASNFGPAARGVLGGKVPARRGFGIRTRGGTTEVVPRAGGGGRRKVPKGMPMKRRAK